MPCETNPPPTVDLFVMVAPDGPAAARPANHQSPHNLHMQMAGPLPGHNTPCCRHSDLTPTLQNSRGARCAAGSWAHSTAGCRRALGIAWHATKELHRHHPWFSSILCTGLASTAWLACTAHTCQQGPCGVMVAIRWRHPESSSWRHSPRTKAAMLPATDASQPTCCCAEVWAPQVAATGSVNPQQEARYVPASKTRPMPQQFVCCSCKAVVCLMTGCGWGKALAAAAANGLEGTGGHNILGHPKCWCVCGSCLHTPWKLSTGLAVPAAMSAAAIRECDCS
jgi:hypothetical protein